MDSDLADKLLSAFQKFRHDNNTPELRLKMEAEAAKVLAEHLKLNPDQVPEHMKPPRIMRMVIRPGERLEIDLKMPRYLIPPEMLPDDDDDTEGEEWKS